jgi:hypothetical protein
LEASERQGDFGESMQGNPCEGRGVARLCSGKVVGDLGEAAHKIVKGFHKQTRSDCLLLAPSRKRCSQGNATQANEDSYN